MIVGFDTSDDALVYKVRDDLAVVQTVDFFPPIVDDPYTFGQIAAANSLSDIYAMGGDPTLSMNLICFPTCLPMDIMAKIMRGGADKVKEAGAIIAGGHTIEDSEPKYGLCVTGFIHPDHVMENSNCKEGDLLVLTKPLGIGVLTTANKAQLLDQQTYDQMVEAMATLNKYGKDVMMEVGANACTDVTGFGLMGHSLEMARGGGATVVIESGNIPFLPGVRAWPRWGSSPRACTATATLPVLHQVEGEVPLAVQDLLYDPQTSGGLLIAVAEKDAQTLLSALKDRIPCAAQVGYVEAKRAAAPLW